MNLFPCVLLALPALACAQAAPPAAKPASDTVVATVGDRKVTVADVEAMLAASPQLRQNFHKDPLGVLHQYFLMRRLAEEALQAGLDKRSPHKENLEHARIQGLATAMMTETSNKLGIGDDEARKHYERHQDRYLRARTKVIYIPYSLTPPPATPGARKVLTEPEASARAASAAKQARAGADFAKLVKEHSEDPASAAKEGDFPAFGRADTKIPEEIRKAVFAAKAGEVAGPVKLANGYYVFRVESIAAPPFDEIRLQLVDEIRQERFDAWFNGLRKEYEVKVLNEAYFRPAGR